VTPARLLIAAAAACAAASAATPAMAQKIAPGLWEHTITMKMSGNPQMEEAMKRMQEQLANMPPEKRQQMEALMARQGGGGLSAGGMAGMMGGKPTTMKVCITPEQAAREPFAAGQNQGNCQQVSQERNGKTVKVKFSCTREDGSSMTGEGNFTMASEKEHSGRMVMDGSSRKGVPMHMEIDQAGRWLGSDCGDVKPHVRANMPPAPPAPPKK